MNVGFYDYPTQITEALREVEVIREAADDRVLNSQTLADIRVRELYDDLEAQLRTINQELELAQAEARVWEVHNDPSHASFANPCTLSFALCQATEVHTPWCDLVRLAQMCKRGSGPERRLAYIGLLVLYSRHSIGPFNGMYLTFLMFSNFEGPENDVSI